MTATASIHSIEDQGPARLKEPAPILMAALKSDMDSDRDRITARLNHVRAQRLHREDRIAELERQLAIERDAVASIDGEEAELIKLDAILSQSQYGMDRLLTEKR